MKPLMSGMRPTGRLHLGNLLGALDNWVRLQDAYNCFFSVVDWHALTTVYEDPGEISANIREMVIDWVSAGLDPERSVLFVQSHVKEHAELHLLLSMIIPIPWLERVPTYKDQIQQLKGKDLSTYGFLGYPLLQSADILVYQAEVVPVGEDQLPHLELTREVARRFNYLYEPVFPEPQALLNRVRLLPGTDGRKMSKSYDNCISMSASPEEVKQKVQQMVTDPARIHKTDPGHPEVCVVHKFLQVFDTETVGETEDDCRAGRIGCVACKKRLLTRLNAFLDPIRERRALLEGQPGLVDGIIADGAERARRIAADTMERVRAAMKLRV
ncbi:MAG: tryptophan--tRNA ligase [Bacillota bacterium]